MCFVHVSVMTICSGASGARCARVFVIPFSHDVKKKSSMFCLTPSHFLFSQLPLKWAAHRLKLVRARGQLELPVHCRRGLWRTKPCVCGRCAPSARSLKVQTYVQTQPMHPIYHLKQWQRCWVTLNTASPRLAAAQACRAPSAPCTAASSCCFWARSFEARRRVF